MLLAMLVITVLISFLPIRMRAMRTGKGLLRKTYLWTPALAFLVILSTATAAEARILYVDSVISSDCAASTYSFAYRSCKGTDGPAYTTASPAIAAMNPGDTVMIRGGVYINPIVIQKSGTAAAHLRITAATGEFVVIDIGATPGAIDGVDVRSQRYVDISGLVIRNAPDFGFIGDSSDHVTLTDSEVAFSGDGGVVFTNASNIIVSNCSVHHSNQKGTSSMMEAISLELVNTFQVTNCRVFDNGKEGIDSKYGSVNGTISGNSLYRNQGPHIYLDGTSFIAVFNNVAHDTTNASTDGIGVSVESTYNTVQAPSHDLLIYNNLIYGNGDGISFWIQTPGLAWARIYNVRIEYNTIADNNRENWEASTSLMAPYQTLGQATSYETTSSGTMLRSEALKASEMTLT